MTPRITDTCIVCNQPMGEKPKFVSNWSVCSEACRKHRRMEKFGGRITTQNGWKHKGYRTPSGDVFTLKHFAILLRNQNGHCALCDSTESLVVDHDKITGIVRGLLCQKHNKGLGLFGDNEAGLLKALQYVRGVPCV